MLIPVHSSTHPVTGVVLGTCSREIDGHLSGVAKDEVVLSSSLEQAVLLILSAMNGRRGREGGGGSSWL